MGGARCAYRCRDWPARAMGVPWRFSANTIDGRSQDGGVNSCRCCINAAEYLNVYILECRAQAAGQPIVDSGKGSQRGRCRSRPQPSRRRCWRSFATSRHWGR